MTGQEYAINVTYKPMHLYMYFEPINTSLAHSPSRLRSHKLEGVPAMLLWVKDPTMGIVSEEAWVWLKKKKITNLKGKVLLLWVGL